MQLWLLIGKTRARIFISILFGLLFFSVVVTPQAFAGVSSKLPDVPNNDFVNAGTSTQIDDVYLFAAKSGAGYALDAGESVVKVYFTSSSGTITIIDGNICGADEGGRDSQWSITNPATVYQMFATDSNESKVGASVAVGSSHNCASRNITLSISGLTQSTVQGHAGYYVAYFYGTYFSGIGGINAYRLQASSGLISYYSGSGNKFAVGQAWLTPARSADYRFQFAPDCGLSGRGGSETAWLNWFDADNGQTNQPTTLNTELWETNPGGGSSNIASFVLSGGNGVADSRSFTARAGYKYEWRLFGVNSRNGVQFQLPYDSINFTQTCDQPPAYNIDVANCKEISGWLFDPDHSNGDIYEQDGTTKNNTTGSMLVHLYKGSAPSVMQGQYVSNQYSGDKAYSPPDPRADVNGTYKIDGRHRFNIDISGISIGVNTFTLYMIGINSDGTVNNNNPAMYNASIGPCFTPVSCSPSTQTVGIGETFTVSAGGGTGVYSWSGPGVPPLTTTSTYSSNFSTPGTYIVTVTDLLTSSSCEIKVGRRPYLYVFGGDVQAGSGFGEACSPSDASAKILTFNRGSGASYLGAGTNMAAFALGTIDGFASAKGGTSAKSLSFSNTAGNSDYGGAFGQTFCADNYWAEAPTAPAPPTSLSISATSVADGTHPVVYVDGDVTISGNIVYSGSGGWTSLSQIPSYYLIVRGNIYIDKAVTQLAGVFVAMPKTGVPNSGKIYTCTNGSTTFGTTIPATVPASGGCENKLTINGAFIARDVRFLRTNGELTQAVSTDDSTSTNIAESFVFGPEIWVR